MSFYPEDEKGGYVGGRSAALLEGGGTSASPLAVGSTANKNFMAYFVRNTAASGDSRLLYMREYFNGAGGGETLRAYATAESAATATGATVNGAHISLSIAAGAQVSGAGNAARFTLDAAADTKVLSGSLAVLELDSNIGAGNTVGQNVAFVKVDDEGAVKINNLLNIPAASNSTIFATHTVQGMTHSIRITDAAGVPYFIMCTNAATNRGGGS